MIDRLLDHFSLLFLGIIGALIIHAVLLFFLLFKNIHTAEPDLSTGLKRAVEVEFMSKDEVIEEQLQAENPNLSPDEIKNLTTYANDDREKSMTDYGRIASEEQIENELLKEYDQKEKDLFDKARKDKAYSTDHLPDASNVDLTNYDEKVALRDNNNAYAGRGMAHLDLGNPKRVSRKGYIKIPGYTGLNGGTIVINIVVDPVGNVVEATVNYGSTTVSETDAIQTALSYAWKERFVRNESAPKKQYGTITYTFKSQ